MIFFILGALNCWLSIALAQYVNRNAHIRLNSGHQLGSIFFTIVFLLAALAFWEYEQLNKENEDAE